MTETPPATPLATPSATTHAPHPLANQRARIDALDDQILALLAERYAILAEVVEIKRAHNIPFCVQARVDEVLIRNETKGQALGLPKGYAHALYTQIIDFAHDFEKSKLVK